MDENTRAIQKALQDRQETLKRQIRQEQDIEQQLTITEELIDIDIKLTVIDLLEKSENEKQRL